MFRPDTLNDTTPEVFHFIRTTSVHEAAGDPPVGGHVLLCGLPRVAALARQRQLLLHTTASRSLSSITSPPFVVVRLVLSLLGSSAAESVLSPTTSTDERDGDGCAVRAASVRSDAVSSQTSASSATDAEAASLPWCTAGAMCESTAEVGYRVVCGGAVDVKAAGACTLLVQTYPVAILPSDVVSTLTQYWRGETPRADSEGQQTPPEKEEEESADASPFTSSPSSQRVSCVDAALDRFRTRVCQHELRCLHSIAQVCTQLLEKCDSTAATQGGNGSLILSVPMYGVALSVEDNQATRLQKVGHLTTPLLRDATSARSPMRAVTAVLHQLHVWAMESATMASSTSPPPSALPSPQVSQQTARHNEFSGLSSAAATLASSASHTLHLSRGQLARLQDYVAQFLNDTSLLTAAVNSSSSLCASDLSLFPRTDHAILQDGLARSMTLPACVVHCQLGVSRSPSVVLLYYIDLYQDCLRRIVQTLSQKEMEKTLSSADTSVRVGNTTKSGVDTAVSIEVFHQLLSALVRARPRVKPNVCFAVQLLSLWNKCIEAK